MHTCVGTEMAPPTGRKPIPPALPAGGPQIAKRRWRAGSVQGDCKQQDRWFQGFDLVGRLARCLGTTTSTLTEWIAQSRRQACEHFTSVLTTNEMPSGKIIGTPTIQFGKMVGSTTRASFGHGDPAFTLRVYTRRLPSSHQRSRMDSRLARLFLPEISLRPAGMSADAHPRDGARDHQALDFGGAFEDGVDLAGTSEGRPAATAYLPSDLRFCSHPFSPLIIACQRPTEQGRSRGSCLGPVRRSSNHSVLRSILGSGRTRAAIRADRARPKGDGNTLTAPSRRSANLV